MRDDKQNSTKCLPCKIVSYCATIGFTCYGLAHFKQHAIPGAIIGTIGLIGLSTITYRDLKHKHQ